MTKKRCTDCKHTKGIGYDFWCGEGHTEYEVFIGETNCPYFEYHDWSKGTPSRTEKRFSQKDEDDWEILDRNKHFAYAHSGYQAKKIIQELNELVETNKELYKENKQLKSTIKGQELEIVRLHHLADAMSGVLKKLGIYDVYNQESEEEFKIIPLSDKNNNNWNGIYNDKTGFITTKLQGNCKAICDKLNEIMEENRQLKMGINSLKLLVQNWEALDEEKDEQLDRQNQALKKLVKENAQLKQLINDKEVEWLRNNTVWEQMPTNKRTVTKTTFGDKND